MAGRRKSTLARKRALLRKKTKREHPRPLALSRRRLRLIASFSGKIVGDKPLSRLAQEMAEQARATFGMDACVIRLLEGDELVLLASAGMPSGTRHRRIPVGWGIAERILELKRPVVLRDIADEPAVLAVQRRLHNPFIFTSYAGTPLMVEDQVIGIFGLYKVKRMEELTEDDLSLLSIFGNNMSAAILNERLYEQVTEQRDRLKAEVRERRRAEQALRESEERFRRIVEDLSEFVVRWTPDGTRTFVNESYARFLGQPVEELVGTSFLNLLSVKEQRTFRERVAQMKPDRHLHTAEYRLHLPDGRTVWCEWTDRPLFDQHGELRELQSVGRDVSERKRLQEQLIRAGKMESIGTLAGGIAHDFGNVLAVILGNVSVLLRQKDLSRKARELLTEVSTAAERGSAFTQQLLAYAHGVTRQPAPLSINPLIRTVFGLLDRIKPQGISFSMVLSPEVPPIMADAVQIEQVIMNLGLNAIEASLPPATIEIESAVRHLDPPSAKELDLPAGTYACITVTDHGGGIGEQLRERIFEPFFTTKPMGRGMGLATTRAIVEDHKGRIQLESHPGEGTTMRTWLPVIAPATP